MDVRTGFISRAPHDSSERPLRPGGPRGSQEQESGLGLKHHRCGISLVSPDRRDLLTLLVYVQDTRAALSSEEDAGDLTAPSFFQRTTSKKHANIQIFTKMHHKKLLETLISSSNATIESFPSHFGFSDDVLTAHQTFPPTCTHYTTCYVRLDLRGGGYSTCREAALSSR